MYLIRFHWSSGVNPGGMGGYIPPTFLGRGDGRTNIPPLFEDKMNLKFDIYCIEILL